MRQGHHVPLLIRISLLLANLTKQPWLSCQAPNHEAGITDHWRKPPGC